MLTFAVGLHDTLDINTVVTPDDIGDASDDAVDTVDGNNLTPDSPEADGNIVNLNLGMQELKSHARDDDDANATMYSTREGPIAGLLPAHKEAALIRGHRRQGDNSGASTLASMLVQCMK